MGEPPDKPSASTAPLGMALGEGRYDRLLIVSFASSLLASPKLNDMVRMLSAFIYANKGEDGDD